MSDLVERLRATDVKRHIDEDAHFFDLTVLRLEAADELSRLTRENKELREAARPTEADDLVAALSDLLGLIKINKRSVLYGMSSREINDLNDAMHKGNVAIRNERTRAGGGK